MDRVAVFLFGLDFPLSLAEEMVLLAILAGAAFAVVRPVVLGAVDWIPPTALSFAVEVVLAVVLCLDVFAFLLGGAIPKATGWRFREDLLTPLKAAAGGVPLCFLPVSRFICLACLLGAPSESLDEGGE